MTRRTIMLIPSGISVGLNSVILGIIRAMERREIPLSLLKIIDQFHSRNDALDQTTSIAHKESTFPPVTEPLKMSYVETLLSKNKKNTLMEDIIAHYYANVQNAKVVLVEGFLPTRKCEFIQSLNFEIANALNAEIVFVMSQGIDTLEQLRKRIGLTCSSFGGVKNSNITGVIINKLNAPISEEGEEYLDLSETLYDPFKAKAIKVDPAKLRDSSPLPVLGTIPWHVDLVSARAIDVVRHLNATIINKGDLTRRIKSITFCTHNIPYMLEHFYTSSLLVTSADRLDVLVAACLATMNGIKLGAILLTGGYEIDAQLSELCKNAFSTGIPVFMVRTNTWQTSLNLQNFNPEIPDDDHERIKRVQEYVANYINEDWIKSLTIPSKRSNRLSPSAFCYRLTELARKANKRIVLPEGSEPRTIKASAICAKRGIATCVLLGNPDEIHHVATSQDVKLGPGIEVVDPILIRENYVSRLVELRKNKGMTPSVAREQLKDNVVLGTLMLEQDEVDGLVSGAVHTTANTIRPPLQLFKTESDGPSLVSSVFFMLLPEQVYVYGDCAINPVPTAAQLAEIAIQSATSAISFGIEPLVAMLSYSTGNSGTGTDVEKVREATQIAQKKRPDLLIDGPLQYDAAVMADVAKFKAPNSPVAGRATVFIFPDLNTGNITYKAVQRSANLVSIGPMLQGMRKPVNDLSRGALVDDIVYTIALTTIQSS